MPFDIAEARKNLEASKKALADVQAQIAKATTDAEKQELMDQVILITKSIQGTDKYERTSPLVDFDPHEAAAKEQELLYKSGYRHPVEKFENPKSYKWMIHKMVKGNPAWTDALEEMQDLNDEMYISAVRRLKNHNDETPIPHHVFKSMPQWARWQALCHTSELKKALDGTSGQGAEWIPTALSANLLEIVRVKLEVASLFRVWDMPTNPWDMPLEGADPIAYKVPQTSSNDIHDKAGAAIASELATAKVTFTADKMGARVVFNEEVEMDSPLNVESHARDKVAIAIANGIENVTLNGSTAGTHPDFDVEDDANTAKRNERLWDGFRQLIEDAGAGSGAQWFDGGVTLNHDDFRNSRKLMGKYGSGSQLKNMVHIVSVLTSYQLLDRTNFPDLQTVDKYGPLAIVLNGEIGKIDGIPVVVSEFQREDVHTGGFNLTGQANASTTVANVNREMYNYGRRTEVRLASETNIETDKTVVVAKARWDAQVVQATTETYISGINNIVP